MASLLLMLKISLCTVYSWLSFPDKSKIVPSVQVAHDWILDLNLCSVGVSSRTQHLEETLQKLHEYNDNHADVDATLRKFEDKVKAHAQLGPAGRDAKHLDKMRVRAPGARENHLVGKNKL